MDLTQESQQFGQLRARIEATFSEPALIVVTSAGRGDGKSVTAFGLAGALADADHRVLLVDANVEAPTLSGVSHRPVNSSRVDLSRVSANANIVSGQRFKGVSFADERLEAGMSLERVKAAVADMQHHFDFVVVDAARLISSNLAVLFATVANGTMLTLRLGRLSTPADDETIKTLSSVGANVLGVLTVTPKMIKNFSERSPEHNILLPVRHVNSKPSIPSVREEANSSSRSTSVR